MRKIILMFLALVAIAASAQERFQRRPCIRGIPEMATKTRALPNPSQNWDPARTYRQAVLLVEYADSTFSMDDPKTYYDQLLNLTSSNTRGGAGCAADYFRDQSNGMFNLQFDVYGPIKVSQSAKRTKSGDNYGDEACLEAVKKAVDSLKVDFSPYDWNQDGEVEQVVLIASSYCGNSGGVYTKFIWPNTYYFFSKRVEVAKNLYVNQYSVSAEKWGNDILCGIGTICHEYAHCLGLPDLYPTDDSMYSMVDEWDLMDGGNYTCWGWNPPNFSALEKQLMGWLSFEDIKEPVQIKEMKPVADGGKAYRMTVEGDKFYYFENRQQKGWDRGLPGKGLTIYSVDYDASTWKNNGVNKKSNYRYQLVHADGLDYDGWDSFVKANGLLAYVDNENRMNRRHLSGSPFPYVSDTLEVNQCDILPMPLTNIYLSDAGTISFDVVLTGINAVVDDDDNDCWYDLQGRKLSGKPARKGVYIHNRRKVAI